MVAISEVLEFHFPSCTWVQRAEVLSDAASSGARRYGHVALAQPGTSALILLNGAEKYGTATQSAACRIHLVPSQLEVADMHQDLVGTSRIAQINRERIAELVEAVQAYETQLRQLKTENATLSERCQALQGQMATLHQQHAALQASFQTVQQALGAVEQFIPMMRSVGAAIANFGSGGWAVPGTTGSLSRAGTVPTTTTGGIHPGSTTTSSDLRQ